MQPTRLPQSSFNLREFFELLEPRTFEEYTHVQEIPSDAIVKQEGESNKYYWLDPDHGPVVLFCENNQYKLDGPEQSDPGFSNEHIDGIIDRAVAYLLC